MSSNRKQPKKLTLWDRPSYNYCLLIKIISPINMVLNTPFTVNTVIFCENVNCLKNFPNYKPTWLTVQENDIVRLFHCKLFENLNNSNFQSKDFKRRISDNLESYLLLFNERQNANFM